MFVVLFIIIKSSLMINHHEEYAAAASVDEVSFTHSQVLYALNIETLHALIYLKLFENLSNLSY